MASVKEPLVSICIPVYSNPEDVRRLLLSIEKQTCQNIEINISDDSDDTRIEELIRTMPEHLRSKIRYVRNATKKGFILNWNAAIQMRDPAADYIKIFFSDDFLTEEESLAKFVSLLEENPEAHLAFSGSRQVKLYEKTEDGDYAYTVRWAEDAFIEGLRRDHRHLFLGNQIGAPSAVLYRNTEPPYLFDEKSGFASDMFLYFDILQDHPAFAWTREPLVSIGLHESQYTQTFTEMDERIYEDYRYLYQKYRLWESEECKDYMIRERILPYRKGYAEARENHIFRGEYICGWIHDRINTLLSFMKSRLQKS